MRKIVITEGPTQEDGTIFAAGSLRSEDQIPVTIEFSWEKIVGRARDFKREENGDISYEIEIRPGVLINLENYDAKVMVLLNDFDGKIVSNAAIKALGLVMDDDVKAVAEACS